MNDGGSAFPRRFTEKDLSGMSLRDWFAGQALASVRVGDWENAEHGAKWCYDYADAMLAERDKCPSS